MFEINSPLLNIPATLTKRQAIFLDGLRQHAQIAIYAYTRLCNSLSELSFAHSSNVEISQDFTHIFLDAWACIEAVDRFRSLWQLQPASDTIPGEFSPKVINGKLQSIRNLRNVASHIAEKIDQIASLNASVSGLIRWITMHSKSPTVIRTYFMRPGIIHGQLSAQFVAPSGKILFTHDVGSILLNAGSHEGNLSDAYSIVCSIVDFMEQHLASKFIGPAFEPRLPANIFGSAQLNV